MSDDDSSIIGRQTNVVVNMCEFNNKIYKNIHKFFKKTKNIR